MKALLPKQNLWTVYLRSGLLALAMSLLLASTVSFRDQNRIQNPGIVLGEIYLMNADGTNPINLTQSVEKPDLVSSWSPDGKQIAFGSSELFVQDDLFRSDIWVIDVDGGNSRNLTKHGAEDVAPAWSPDGNQIAFSSNRDGNWEVYVMNADGTAPINLTQHPAWDGGPSWGPAPTLNVSSKGKLATLWGGVKRVR